MAIIDDIKGTITKTSKAAAKKTKDIAGIARLTSEIENTKSLIKDVYLEIGKKYCELYTKDTAADDFTVDVATVENLKEQLLALKKERLKLRGKVQCSECGGQAEMEYDFCPYCGAKLPEHESPDSADGDIVEADVADAVADDDEEIDEDE